MKISVKHTGIVTLHFLYLTFGPLSEATSQCTAPATELTKEATFTCIFPVDVSMSKTDFTVYYGKEKVAECMWVQGKLKCTLKTGYKQDNQPVTKHFTLRIPRFLQNHTGRYSCDVTGYDKEVCTLFQRTATSQVSAQHTVSTLVPQINSDDGTSNDDKATSTVLIIVVCTVGACLAVASAAVVVYVVYKCVRGKASPSKPDDMPTVQTEGQDAKKSCDNPPIERQPTPESNAGHQANVTTNLLSETDVRSTSSEHRYTCNLQQEQIDSPSRKKDCDCDHVSHTPVPGRSSTPRNQWPCCRHGLSQGCVKSRGHEACEVSRRCGPTGEQHVTKATEDSTDEDENCIDEHTCHIIDRLATSADLSRCFERYLHLLETRVLHEEFLKKITGKRVTSELSEEAMPSNGNKKMFPGIQMREAHPSPAQ